MSSLQNLTLQELEKLLEQLENNEEATQERLPQANDDFYYSLFGLGALSPNHRPYSLFSQFSNPVVYVCNIEKCREAVGVGLSVSKPLDVNNEIDSSDSF